MTAVEMSQFYSQPEPTPFPKSWLEPLRSAAEWIARSWSASGETGAAAYYSALLPRRAKRRWAAPYPETTGYIVPTLIECSHMLGDNRYAEIAIRMADWLVQLQAGDGSYPAGLQNGTSQPPSTFNTAQILKGLLAAYERSLDVRYLQSALKAATWLADTQDRDGAWRKYSLNPGFSPSYYSEICWPMLSVYRVTGASRFREGAIQGLRFICNRQKNNGAISGWGFDEHGKAFTHTIGYTIRGLLESALLLEQGGEAFWECGVRSATALQQLYAADGMLAGRYSENWRPSKSFECITGSCQIALCWYVIYENTQADQFAVSARSIVKQVDRKSTRLNSSHYSRSRMPSSA